MRRLDRRHRQTAIEAEEERECRCANDMKNDIEAAMNRLGNGV